VVVEGDAVRVTGDALLRRLADAWRAKWEGGWQSGVQDGCFRHPGGGPALVFISFICAASKSKPFTAV
jgi:hypothetical protein